MKPRKEATLAGSSPPVAVLLSHACALACLRLGYGERGARDAVAAADARQSIVSGAAVSGPTGSARWRCRQVVVMLRVGTCRHYLRYRYRPSVSPSQFVASSLYSQAGLLLRTLNK
eukprot:GHVU01106949.1.p1 GENE.GHVU01106949.1~~GHVU01106949.1.p1  ORF type:complete len:116 (+),score=3.98 GHVU01106949.1:299-646(+)